MQSADIPIPNTPTAEDVLTNEQLYGQYTMASANIVNFLPSIDASTHLDIFVNMLRHQKASKLEQGSISVLNNIEIEGFSTSYNSFIHNKTATFYLSAILRNSTLNILNR